MTRARALACTAVVAACLPPGVEGQARDSLVAPYPEELCPPCAAWNSAQAPFRIHGNTYFVGTRGLSALLITSAEGHVLIDAGLPNSAPLIIDNIRSLGFEVADVELILNSHAHYDHAGGIAAIQRASGARVAASSPSAVVLKRGSPGPNDPQYGVALDFPPIERVEQFFDADTLMIGVLTLAAHLTPGHTPGGTTWSWESCEGDTCVHIVYADSQTPVSAEGFRFTDGSTYPSAVADFERGFAILESLPCDILLTPHPGASSMWERLGSGPRGLIDPDACQRYAASARQQLARRLEAEAAR